MAGSTILCGCTFDLWQETQHEPQFPCVDEDISIEVEGNHCGTGNGSTWYEARIGGTPPEMCVPRIGAWIEQAHQTSRARIMGLDAIMFVKIAVRASIAQVIELGLASTHLRHNVINVERLRRDDLRGVAILATVTRTFCDPTCQRQGNIGHKRRTAQDRLDWRMACALRRAALVRRT